MDVLNQNEDKYEKRRRQSTRTKGLLVALAFAMVLTVYSIFGPTNRIVQKQREKAIQNTPKKMLMKMVEVREMPHEFVLRKTIRDCLPSTQPNNNNKCKTFVPERSTAGDAEKVQRVAMIAPPGKLASAIRNHMKLVADQFNNRNDRKEPKIKVIETSHVPPYGYGKSHGLTKIVKFMPQPVLLQVIDAFKALLGPKQSIETITLEDLQVGLLQIMRFHCRLSHVAAHTASFSIDPKTLVNHTQLGLSLRDFMAPATSTKDVQASNQQQDDDDTAVTADDDEMRVIYDQKSIGASILTRLSEKLTDGETTVLELLDGVLQQEMERTKGLTVWPCPSFWEAPAPLQLSDLTKKLATALSPDCADPYASCFVQRDKCEANGDAVCKKK